MNTGNKSLVEIERLDFEPSPDAKDQYVVEHDTDGNNLIFHHWNGRIFVVHYDPENTFFFEDCGPARSTEVDERL